MTCFHLFTVHYFKEKKELGHTFPDKQKVINFSGKQSSWFSVLDSMRLFYNFYSTEQSIVICFQV